MTDYVVSKVYTPEFKKYIQQINSIDTRVSNFLEILSNPLFNFKTCELRKIENKMVLVITYLPQSKYLIKVNTKITRTIEIDYYHKFYGINKDIISIFIYDTTLVDDIKKIIVYYLTMVCRNYLNDITKLYSFYEYRNICCSR